jgi:hypothetical protein
MPVLKFPIHVSYILYLSSLVPALAMRYFRAGLCLCRLTGTQPSLLLHPLDFLGCDDTQDLSFFPGMRMPSEKKLAVVSEVLRLFSDQFTVLTIQQHAHEAAHKPNLSLVAPRFCHKM